MKRLQDEEVAAEKAAAEKRKAEEEKVCGTESDAMVAPVSPVHCPAGAQKGGGGRAQGGRSQRRRPREARGARACDWGDAESLKTVQ